MNEEIQFDYRNYIQERLKEIDDLDERKYAKELLLDGLGRLFDLTEERYQALEGRILRELDVPWKRFCTHMTIIEKKDYDPISSFWFPVCEDDVKQGSHQKYETFYLMADEIMCRKFFDQETVEGIEEESGRRIAFQIRRPYRYQEAVKKLYSLFADNHIPWQIIHMGHLDRFFEMIPIENMNESTDNKVRFKWDRWEEYVKSGMIPLWNMNKATINSREFRVPCIDEVLYEHIFYLPKEKQEDDGYLVEAKEDILSIRYEKSKVLLRTGQESMQNVSVCRLHQERPADPLGYRYPVLSNCKKGNMSGRYLHQTGNFLQTPMELYRKIEELSGSYDIDILAYQIMDRSAEDVLIKEALYGDMNEFAGIQVFADDKRNILLLTIRKAEQQQGDYLYESQIRYILSQLQMEFMEYKCVGMVV